MSGDGESSTEPDSVVHHGTEHASIELVRVIDRTIHVSNVDRKKEAEYTIRNNSDEAVNYVFLPLRDFKVNLQVYDEGGRRLNYYPNSEVEEIIDNVKGEDEDAYERMKHRFKHTDYQLFLQLPPERPLQPSELRTITLTFEQSETVDFYDLTEPSILRGWLSDWKKKFFKIPSFLANARRYPGHPHDEFVIVTGTTGYATIGTIENDARDTDGEFYENGLDDDTRVFSARLPPAAGKPYTWTLEYDLIPTSQNLMRALALYWVVVVFLGVVSTVVSALGLAEGFGVMGRTLSGAIVTGTLGIIFALDANWADRYKLLSVVPLLLHGVAWFLWTASVAGSS